MRVAPIASRLADLVPAFGGRVLSALSGAVPAAYPAAYVLPLSEQLVDVSVDMDHALIEARAGVEIMVKHAAQTASGGPAGEALEDLREATAAALVGWRPDPSAGPMSLAAGKLVSLADGIAIWRDEYVYTFIRS